MIKVFDGRPHHLLEKLKIKEHASLVELFSCKRDEDLVVVAVRILALAAVVAEVVAGGKTGFYSYFKHDLGSLQYFNGRVAVGLEAEGRGSSLP
jgi:hypothetical protein